jgi:hypothetical protein
VTNGPAECKRRRCDGTSAGEPLNASCGRKRFATRISCLQKPCVHVCRSAQVVYFLASGSQNFCSSSMKRLSSAP